jgi:hypothetical protein
VERMTIEAFVDDLKRRAVLAKGEPVFGVHGKWSVGFSESETTRHLSARLVVDASDEEDWKTLGRLAARLGSPPEPMGGFPENAMATLHWDWSVST